MALSNKVGLELVSQVGRFRCYLVMFILWFELVAGSGLLR